MAKKRNNNLIDNELQDFLFDEGSSKKPQVTKSANRPVQNKASVPGGRTTGNSTNRQQVRTQAVNKREANLNRADNEATRKVKKVEELNARYEAALKAKQQAEAKAKREAQAKAKQEAELKAKREAALKAKQEAELKAKREAALRAKQEAELKAKREAQLRAKQEAERKQLEALKAQKLAELQAKKEAQARAQQEAQRRQLEAIKAQKIAELKAKKEAQARAQHEAKQSARQVAERRAANAESNAAAQARMLEDLRAQFAAEQSPAPKATTVIDKGDLTRASSKDIASEISESKQSRKTSKKAKDNSAPKEKGFFKNLWNNIPEERNFIQKIFLPKSKPVTRKDKALLAARYMAICCVAFIFMASSFTVYAIATAPKINPENIYDQIAQSSTIYDDQGEELCTVDAGQDRTLVQYDELPPDLVNAVVALEDKTFWKHHGFNWIRIGGAVLQAFTNGGHISGTSTITQQLARNVYLPEIKSERSMKRKIIEMYYSAKIEHTLSKEDIFAAYINSIYFGFGNYGVEAAANTYFSKHVSDLDLIECATLAALPQSPDAYAPLEYMSSEALSESYASIITIDDTDYICNDISKGRRDICLELMNDQGYISSEDLKNNEGTDLKDYLNPTIKEDDSNVASYFKEYAIEQVVADLVEEYNITEEEATNMVYAGGLSIYTTMDRAAQESIEKSFEDDSYFPGYTNLNKNKYGDIVTESGDISLYNAENYFNNNGNFVLKKGEFKVNDDGSLTITSHKRLYFYVTETESGTDYSIEFKPFYEVKDGKMYIHQGGYMNIPLTEKTMAENDDVTISADFVKENAEYMHPSAESDDKYVIESELFTTEPGVVQPQAAMVITEVGTGELKAMVGGRGIKGSNLYNRATSTRQPGSSLKPLAVYSAALQKSYEYAEKGEKFEYTDYHIDKQGTSRYGDYLTAASTVVDEPTKIEGKIWPTNASGKYSGAITMRRALQMSVNVSAVKIFLQVGKEYSADMVEKFGITTLERSGEYSDLNPSGLGMGGLSNGVSPLEMAEAYTTFPNGGVRNTTIAYSRVVDKYGSTILNSKSESIKVLDEGVAFIMTDMLKSVVTKGIGGNAKVKGVEVGGKTGTTSSNYDIWFDGFTPSYAAALWIGSDVNISLTSDSSSAARLWSHIMSQIPAAKEGEYRPKPANIVEYKGEYFTKGTETGRANADNANNEPVENPLPEEDDGAVPIEPDVTEDTTTDNNNNNSSGGNSSSGGNNSSGSGGNGGVIIDPGGTETPEPDPGSNPEPEPEPEVANE